ncbi:MAG: MBL fold metallo-hydrolase [Deltaproteobacteria bacterium]|nr:MAG: MBL fold metallo-hydrolase [Deltaproteobacteria bacterium]
MKMPVEKRLHELGNGIFAYTQLPGSWGWSNAGLITDGDQCLLVDTLFDKKLTAEMLESMRRAAPAAARIGTVVNTHGNGDHCYGNALVADAEIIGTRGCVEDLREAPPSRNQLLMRAAGIIGGLGAGGRVLGRALNAVGIDRVALLADAAPLATALFGDFDFTNNDVVLPTRTFERELSLTVGDKRVELIEVGPAHTLGDAVVWVPKDRTLFTGDILFKDSHPVIWEGPVSNWVAACERLLDMDIETVVPGHGPLTDKSALRETLRYLEALTEQARTRYDAGMSVDDAAHEVAFEEFDHWIDAERVYVNVHTLYREFSGDTEPADILALFAGMARLQARKAGAL